MKIKFFFLIILFAVSFIFTASPAFANNLVISNVTLEDRNPSANTMVVQFDISWDHSWRKNDGRHDAAWVFAKIYGAPAGSSEYTHIKLYTAGTNPTNSSPGSNPDTKIVVPSDKVGAFISRQATGNGTFSSKKVRLTFDYGSSGNPDVDTVRIYLYGIEMVYIPEGPFYVGDGDGSQESSYAFHVTDNTARQITTTGSAITVDSNSSDDIDTSPVTVTGLAGITGNTSWPNGYDDFYLMKYELTQGQYLDFLNTLSRVQQGTRVASTVSGNTITNFYVISNSASLSRRSGIRAPASGNGTSPTTITFGMDFNSNGTFNEGDDGRNISIVYLSWMDLLAYADWAGLRPFTELEFEKAARGTNNAVYAEYSWGNTKITQAQGPGLNLGRSDEVASSTGEGLAQYDGSGTDLFGPFRAGFAATVASNRKSAGAGFYGNMELSGNANERTVTLGNSQGRAFTGTHGDGTLTTTASYEGNATNNDWPGIDATTARGVTGASGCGFRGGGRDSSTAYLQTSDRLFASTTISSRSELYGGRLARTAP
jgi:formylglycine-generating enzyme required for sulfatase activity